MLEIDGSYMEGGGQVLRTAVGLAAATGRACRIRNIRKGRSNTGLAAQHLAGVRAVAELCGAELRGDEMGSTELEFRPGALDPPREVTVEVGTAGSVTLVLQGLMIPLALAGRPVEVSVTGGTHVKWSPTTDYFQQVTAWFLGLMGVRTPVLQVRPGFYPKGGGLIRLEVRPAPPEPLRLAERGEGQGIAARSIASERLRKAHVAERQLKGVREVLTPDRERAEYVDSPSVGTAVLVRADYANCRLAGSALGERGKPSEVVGAEAARNLQRQLEGGACLDEHTADQILPYLALAGGESRVSVAAVTDHCRTNTWVIRQFLPVAFDIDETAGMAAGVITVSP